MSPSSNLLIKSETTGTLLVRISSSKFLSILIISAMTVATVSIVVCHLHFILKFFFIFIVLVYTYHNLKKYAFCSSKDAIVSCEMLNSCVWRLTTRQGASFSAQPCVYSYRSSTLVILYFKRSYPQKRVKVPVAFDATSKLTFMRLLSRLWITGH